MIDAHLEYKKLSINKTEQVILHFMLSRAEASSNVDLGYSTYSNDKELQIFTKKTQPWLHRSLRHLEELGLLTSSHKKPFRGTPILFSLTFPQYCQIKRLIGRGKGDMLAQYIHAYTRRTHNPVCSGELAVQLRVKKRQVQRSLKTLVDQGVMRRTTMHHYSRRRQRYVKIPAYELTEGQKPITHWMQHH